MWLRLRRNFSRLLGELVRYCAARNIVWPWVDIVARHVVPFAPAETVANLEAGSSQPIRILALSSERFVGDLRVLSSLDGFEVYTLRHPWQSRVNSLFTRINERPVTENHVPEDCEAGIVNFMRALFARLGIDIVVGAAIWYRADIPWGSTAQKVGVPYIVLHRECLKSRRTHQEWVMGRARPFGGPDGFVGHKIIFHNQIMCDVMQEMGFAQPDRTVNAGCLRMDEFVREVFDRRSGELAAMPGSGPGTGQRRKAAMFSFAPGMGLYDLGVDPYPQELFVGWFRIFELSHAAFAAAAMARPDVDFLIKPKWGGYWTEWIEKSIRANGMEPDDIANLTISADLDAHDLIFNSAVVCSFASTTLLEAGFAGKPVIVPDFEESKRKIYRDRVPLLDYYDLFDVVESAEQMTRRILERLKDDSIDPEVQQRRDEAFDEWVSRSRGGAVRQYVEVLRDAAGWGRRQRGLDRLALPAMPDLPEELPELPLQVPSESLSARRV